MRTLPSLNPQQQKAIHATEGRVLILAGAGSGKTSVLTHRIAHLIQNQNVSPESILGLTFTNKAAEEMRHRLSTLIPPAAAKKVMLCTFHSFCMWVLRREIEALGYTKNFSLYDEKDIRRLVTHIAKELLEHEGELPSLSPTLELINEAKSEGVFTHTGDQWHDKFSKEVFETLQVTMRAYNAVDFDSLLTLTVQLFDQFPELKEIYAKRFCYIMIDEYQDTNPIQYRLADQMASHHNNLCVVGDDDQSIYGWRGAKVENILNFPADVTIKLEQNYRSTSTILAAANSVISKNKNRHQKELWTKKSETHPIEIFHAPTEVDEAEAVINRILHLRDALKLKWKDFAILYRSNTLVRPFETALLKALWKKDDKWMRGIPYQVFGGTEIFERSEVKDLMAYLRLVANPSDQEAILRIINFPRRGISEQTLDRITQHNRSNKLPLWNVIETIVRKEHPLCSELSERAQNSLKSFYTLIEEARRDFSQAPLHQCLNGLVEKLDFKKAVSDEVKSEKMKEFKRENIDSCVEQLKAFEEENPDSSLAQFLSSSLLNQTNFERQKKGFEDKVNLMTFHSAKGLEFPVCFLIGLENHLIPHEKSLLDVGIEEERRLFYVAMTRAKERLILSMARSRSRMGKEMASEPSQFLYEIQNQLLKVTAYNANLPSLYEIPLDQPIEAR